MFWLYLTISILATLAFLSAVLYWFVKWLSGVEPYATFIRMRTRHKLRFFRMLLRDENKRVPWYVKSIPVILVLYLSMPFDIIPDFVPVLGYLDDVAIALLALVLVIKLTPRDAVLDLLKDAGKDAPSTTDSETP